MRFGVMGGELFPTHPTRLSLCTSPARVLSGAGDQRCGAELRDAGREWGGE